MARGKQSVALSTITLAQADAFLSKASVNKQLFCKKIPGFYLMKLKADGAWRYRYRDVASKRRVYTIGPYSTLKPAEAAEIAHSFYENEIDPLTQQRIHKQERLEALREAERQTLRYYLDTYYRPRMERAWKAQNAQVNYNRIAGHFDFLLDREMSTISKKDIDEWQRKQENRGLAYITLKRVYGALKTLLRQAVSDGMLAADPLDSHKLLEPSLKDQKATMADNKKSERRLLTDAEITSILKGLDLFSEEIRQQRRNSRKHGKPELPDLDKVNYPHWFIPYCHLALHTGLRPGDLYTLTWQELNITFGRLTKVCEKTAHAIRREKKPTTVDLKLNATILDIMTLWHKDQGEPRTGLVYPSPVTGKVLDRQAYRRPWSHVKRLGGLPEGLNFYALRHHFISALLAAGVPIFTVAKLAGHKSTAMIESHYGHLCPDQAIVALDIVAQSVTGRGKLTAF